MAAANPVHTVPVDIRATRDGTLLLNVPSSLWPPPTHVARIDGDSFVPKKELHVTLLGISQSDEVNAQLSPRLRRRLWAQARTWQWRIDRTGDLRLLEHLDPAEPAAPASRSIIETIELAGAEEFYRLLEQQLGRQLSRPPPHVTLYTLHNPGGIGVPDEGTLRRLTVRTLAREELEPS